MRYCMQKPMTISIITPQTLKQDASHLKWGMKWDILVLDEGHRAKNMKTQLNSCLKQFPV